VITAFEVGSVFKIIDQASPALRKILAEVRQLNLALDKARASLATVGKFAAPTGLTAAVAQNQRTRQGLVGCCQECRDCSALDRGGFDYRDAHGVASGGGGRNRWRWSASAKLARRWWWRSLACLWSWRQHPGGSHVSSRWRRHGRRRPARLWRL